MRIAGFEYRLQPLRWLAPAQSATAEGPYLPTGEGGAARLAFLEDKVDRSPLVPICCSLMAEVKLSLMSALAPEADLNISLTLLLCPVNS